MLFLTAWCSAYRVRVRWFGILRFTKLTKPFYNLSLLLYSGHCNTFHTIELSYLLFFLVLCKRQNEKKNNTYHNTKTICNIQHHIGQVLHTQQATRIFRFVDSTLKSCRSSDVKWTTQTPHQCIHARARLAECIEAMAIKTGQGRRVRIETRNVEHMWRDGGAHRVADTEPLQAVSTQKQEGSLLRLVNQNKGTQQAGKIIYLISSVSHAIKSIPRSKSGSYACRAIII